MCITVEEANLSSTVILAHQVEHEGRKVNVLGYQNTARSLGDNRQNAMLLPIPSAAPMSQKNCIDMTGADELFTDYHRLFDPPVRTKSRGIAVASGSAAAGDFEVFESGEYTVVLMRQLPLVELRKALKNLPGGYSIDFDMRKARMFRAFKKYYPDWHLALCLWTGEAKAPMLWWYEPMMAYQHFHFLPGLDAHDGEPPDPSLRSVNIDHTLVVGAQGQGAKDATSIVHKAPPHLRKWLPESVFGVQKKGQQARNGDWVLPAMEWSHNAAQKRFQQPRVAPPGFKE